MTPREQIYLDYHNRCKAVAAEMGVTLYGSSFNAGFTDTNQGDVSHKAVVTIERLRAALTAERARWRAFADEKGEPRKVLGTLPVTADGFFVGKGAKLHPLHPLDLGSAFGDGEDDYCTVELTFYVIPPEGGRLTEDDEAQINTCYATRENAAAARLSGEHA